MYKSYSAVVVAVLLLFTVCSLVPSLPTVVQLVPREPAPEPLNTTVEDAEQRDVQLDMMHFSPSASSEDGICYVARRGVDTIAYFGESEVWYVVGDTLLHLDFPGSTRVIAVGEEPACSVTNYILGNDPTRWRTGLVDCAILRYIDIYPGIDLVYKILDGNLKYEFVVAPHADPSQIRFRCLGADVVEVRGNAIAFWRDGLLIEDSGLVAKQDEIDIGAQFQVGLDDLVGFAVDEYDESKELVIDPLIFATFWGGSGYDDGRKVCVDSANNIYTCGIAGVDFPTVNAYNSTFGGGYQDCFIAKMTPSGTIVFSTYIGGSEWEWPADILITSAGETCVVGQTFSQDFPTKNAMDSTLSGQRDGFILELSSTGDELIYSTLLGGSSTDYIRAVIEDQGFIEVVGSTSSSDFPVTIGTAMNETYNGVMDCFLTQLNATRNGLSYSTYFGGSGADWCHGLVTSDWGYVWVCGITQSTDFPVTTDLSTTSGTMDEDVFVCCFENDFVLKKNLSYSTIVGGGNLDEAYDLVADGLGSAYVTGSTWSTDFPIKNAYDSSYGGGSDSGGDCFVFKLNVGGGSLAYCTYLGGSSDDSATKIILDSHNCPIITGWTRSMDYPTYRAYDSSFGAGIDDCIFTKLNESGNGLQFSTFIGGSGSDSGHEITFDSSGSMILVGSSNSSDFPFVNAIDSQAGDYDAFILKCSADMAYPEISQVSINPENPTETDAVEVIANVVEDNTLDYVELHYRFNDGVWTNNTMELEEGSLNWHGSIPARPAGTTVQYWISASDTSGNERFTGLQSYEVASAVINPASVQLRLAAIGASATVLFGALGFVFKSSIIEKKNDKVAVVIFGVTVFVIVTLIIWRYL